MGITLDNALQANLSPLMWTMNVFGNKSEVFELPFYNRQIRIVSMTIIATLAFVGNLAVLHRTCCKCKKRKIDFLVTNLAAADLCVSIVTLLPQIIGESLDGEWPVGDLACRFFRVLQAFGLSASSNIIAVIALERHHVIVTPMDSPFPARILAAVPWICALFLAAPQVYLFKMAVRGKSRKCLYTFDQLPLQMFLIFEATVAFLAPFCTLCVVLIRILWTICRKACLIENCKLSGEGDQNQINRSTDTSSSLPRAKIKTLKMVLVICILFIICRLPYFIIELEVAFGALPEADVEMIGLLGIFVVSNSAVNPYAYLFFKTDNIHLSRLEKRVCFSCLKGCRENTFHRRIGENTRNTPA